MKEKLARVQSDLNLFLSKQPSNITTSLDEIEKVILYIVNTVDQIKTQFQNEDFESIEEEIAFFKYYKPEIISKLYLFNSHYRISKEKPSYCSKSEYQYYKRELKKKKILLRRKSRILQILQI